MIFEILATSSMAGVAGVSYLFKNGGQDDHEKIKRIADENGLKTKDESIRIYRKNHYKNYSEYVYKMPLGLSFKKFQEHRQVFVDGLNNKSQQQFNLKSFKQIKWFGNVPRQIYEIATKRTELNKQLELEYDGMIKFKVFHEGIDDMYEYNDNLLEELSGWQVPVGYTHSGLIKHDFEKLPMLVVAGTTRYGKTVFLKNLITSLIHNKPYKAKFTLIDLKGGLAFSRFAKCKQVNRVAKDAPETIQALEDIHKEMKERQAEFLEKGYEDITESNYKHRHFIVIDEGAEIATFENKKDRERCTHLVGEIARIGAGLSYRVIFATQYPTADVFPRAVKSNTSASLCFKLKNSTQSMVVLDRAGAEELPVGVRGRAIYQTDREQVIQSPFIENKFIDEKIKDYKEDKNASEKPGKNRTDVVKFEKL